MLGCGPKFSFSFSLQENPISICKDYDQNDNFPCHHQSFRNQQPRHHGRGGEMNTYGPCKRHVCRAGMTSDGHPCQSKLGLNLTIYDIDVTS